MKVKKPIGKKFRASGTTAKKKKKDQKKINEYVLELEAKVTALKDQLAVQIDTAFLKELVEQARKYGWIGDYVEVRDFVQHCFREADKTPPTDAELEPYELEEQ